MICVLQSNFLWTFPFNVVVRHHNFNNQETLWKLLECISRHPKLGVFPIELNLLVWTEERTFCFGLFFYTTQGSVCFTLKFLLSVPSSINFEIPKELYFELSSFWIHCAVCFIVPISLCQCIQKASFITFQLKSSITNCSWNFSSNIIVTQAKKNTSLLPLL